VFWALRWFTHYLGNNRRNFVGDSIPSWLNEVANFSEQLDFSIDPAMQLRESHLSILKQHDGRRPPVPVPHSLNGQNARPSCSYAGGFENGQRSPVPSTR
jgi:hypothetical protein